MTKKSKNNIKGKMVNLSKAYIKTMLLFNRAQFLTIILFVYSLGLVNIALMNSRFEGFLISVSQKPSVSSVFEISKRPSIFPDFIIETYLLFFKSL